MRVWTIHPKYLDDKGLGGVWMDALLVQKLVHGGECGNYRKHPQCQRWLKGPMERYLLSIYLIEVWLEAKMRGFDYKHEKITMVDAPNSASNQPSRMLVDAEEVKVEKDLLVTKLRDRGEDQRALDLEMDYEAGRSIVATVFCSPEPEDAE
jgi:hypothetical protein